MTPPINPRDLDAICEQTEALWDEVRNKRLFLTGGTGFFGCWLVESFAAANRRFALNAQITVLTRSPKRFRDRCPHLVADSSVSLHEGDVRSFLPPGEEFSFIIHAAAETGDARIGRKAGSSLSTLSTIFDGTRNTLEFAITHGARKFLMISSGAVYGTQPKTISHLAESYPGAPFPYLASNAYGEAKRAAEALCAAYATPDGLACKIARCYSFVGPHLPLDGSFAIGNFIQNALAAQPIRVQGDGSAVRSYLYATDLTVWLWRLLFEAPSLQPFNVGSEEAISIRDLANEVRTVLNPGLKIEVLGRSLEGAQASRYVPSVQKARDHLALKQTVELREAIQRTAEWFGWRRPEGATN